MHNRLYRLSHGIMTALACLLTVLVFLLNVLYQSEVSYTEYEVTTISGSLKFSLLVLVIYAVRIFNIISHQSQCMLSLYRKNK